MTTAPHHSRRPWGGASLARNVSSGYEPRVSMYELLHPEQFAEIPSSKPVKSPPEVKPKRQATKKQEKKPAAPRLDSQEIINYLKNGDATAKQIAEALNVSSDTVRLRLWRGINGVVRKGTHVTERGSPGQEWGIKEE